MTGGLTTAELSALRTFLAVYRWGAVGKAAEALHLSQPAVSHHVKTLEQAAGRPLFTRSGRGIAPTAAGHALAAEVSEHVDALERAVFSLRPTLATDAGIIFLGSPGEVLADMVVPYTTPLLDAGIRLRCRTGMVDELLDALLDDQLDIAVLTRIEGAPNKKLYLLHWRDEEFVLIGKRGEVPYDPTDIARRFVGYSESMPMARRYFRMCWGIAAPAPVLTVPDMRTVASAVRAGAGLAVVPMYIAQQGIADRSLEVLHTPPKPVLNSLHLATRRGREHEPRVRAVLNHLVT
ncbi:LysR family transcriptional regulator [Kibdelosporangium aridum]|uniref:LysR family transcriptional regulator n=1 Tax=Kibdelosporangium aridum TaxID=2030 RepID=UPI00068E5F91